MSEGKYGYAGPKLWCNNMTGAYDSNNYKVFRYADAVLMMAECYAMKNNWSLALSYLNRTRLRAGLDALYGVNDRQTFMEELMNERARELAGELHRKYDLVRWGVWYEKTLAHNPYTALTRDNMREYHEYYPIPDSECALSGYILTNDAYNSD